MRAWSINKNDSYLLYYNVGFASNGYRYLNIRFNFISFTADCIAEYFPLRKAKSKIALAHYKAFPQLKRLGDLAVF
jgi:hypothetical protein